jgi:hypothetical protein
MKEYKMAKIEYNLLVEAIRGKVGSRLVLVRGNSVNYLRRLGHYTDPKTMAQMAVRDVFATVIHIAKAINDPILKPYTFPRPPKGKTPFNWMAHINQPLFAHNGMDFALLKIFDGPVYNPGFQLLDLTGQGTPNEEVTAEYDGMPGDTKDIAILILYDEVRESCLYGFAERGTQLITIKTGQLGPIADKDKVHGYRVFVHPPTPGTNETGQVSRTVYGKLT